jgi:thymidylate synthase (FAD)
VIIAQDGQLMGKKVTILTEAPIVAPLAQMELIPSGIEAMIDWVASHRPECLPDEGRHISALFPHDMAVEDGRPLTDNELLVELAGRKCYDSFGAKAGRKSNKAYIENTQQGDIPHASILYHAKISFFFAGVSRRVSHEIIRNYVGADRDEEGAPSQESTRFTHHYGFFICPPKYLGEDPSMKEHFEHSMQKAYSNYLIAVDKECKVWEEKHGKPPTSLDKKRIYEAASSFLPHQAETSFIWTTNPSAIAKLCRERDNIHADLEIQRFARKLKQVSVARYPNLFTQPWMKEGL